MDDGICSAWLFPWSSGTLGYMNAIEEIKEKRHPRVPAESVKTRAVWLHALKDKKCVLR